MNYHLQQSVSINKELSVRTFAINDSKEICSWVKSENALKIISGNHAGKLTLFILNSWIANSICAVVCTIDRGQSPIAFCTLSRKENKKVPPSFIEICHLIVHPKHRNKRVGTTLLNAAISNAIMLGYNNICWRIDPFNSVALNLAGPSKADEITGRYPWTEHGFRWFRTTTLINNQEAL